MTNATNWKHTVAASADPPLAPQWTAASAPLCDERCPHHDGKRCRVTGFRPSNICEPAVLEMARLLTEARR